MIAEARRRLGMALRLPDSDGWWNALPIAIGGLILIAATATISGLARFDPLPIGWAHGCAMPPCWRSCPVWARKSCSAA